MSEMKIAVQTLNTDYLNSHFKGAISKNEPDKNIEDLNIFISDGKLNVLWKDCDNSHWKKTYIAKLKNQIPSSAFENAIVELTKAQSSLLKNLFTVGGLVLTNNDETLEKKLIKGNFALYSMSTNPNNWGLNVIGIKDLLKDYIEVIL